MKKKSDIKKLALMGLATGLLMANQGSAAETNSGANSVGGQEIAARCGAKSCAGRSNCHGRSNCSGHSSCQGRSNCSGRTGCQGRSNCSGHSQCYSRANCSARSNCNGIIADAWDEQHQKQNHKTVTESEILQKLSPEGQNAYQRLDSESRAYAIELINRHCNGKADCKGMNPDDAVRAAAQKMAEKRNNSVNPAPKYYYNY